MKKIISGLISAVLFSALTAGACASAETILVDSNYPINCNRCGNVIVKSSIERDVKVSIKQISEDGSYDFYDTVIPASENDNEYSFVLEGKDDVSYTISIGVSKYKNSSNLQEYNDNFYIYDTDEITDEKISGYEYTYTVNKDEEQTSEKVTENVKDENNYVKSLTNIYFPVVDYMAGDANSDGKLNVRDAAFIASKLAHSANGNEIPEWADFNGDGVVNIRDAAAIARMLAGGKK